MKKLPTVFILASLLLLNRAEAQPHMETTPTTEKICLPVSRKSLPLTDFSNPSNAKLSPDGRRLLYGGKKDKKVSPVILLDLNTGKKTELLPSYSLSSTENEILTNNDGYGFAGQGVWVWSHKTGDIKLKSLPDGEEKWIHKDTGFQIFRSGIHQEDGILWSMGVDKTHFESMIAFEQELKSKTDEEREKLRKEFLDMKNSLSLTIQLVEMDTFSETRKTFTNEDLGSCNAFGDSLNFFSVHEDGSLYKTDLKTESDPVKVFGPVEGLKLPHFLNPKSSGQCAFQQHPFSVLNIIRKPSGGYLLRVVEEGKEFHLPGNLFDLRVQINGEVQTVPRAFPDLHDLLNRFIRYPFVISSSATKSTSVRQLLHAIGSGSVTVPETVEWLIHHIPSQTTQIKRNTNITSDWRGLFAFEETKRGKENFLQAVLRPFDSEKRRVLLEVDTSGLCLVKYTKNHAFLNTAWGDLFIIDIKTGSINRRDVGQCLSEINAVSENTVVLRNRHHSYTAHRFRDRCFEPVSDVTDIKQALSRTAEASDPTDASSLAPFLAALEKDSPNTHPEQVRRALRNILSQSPTMFLHLHRRFPSLNQMPVPPVREIFNPKRKKKLEASTASVLKFTTEEYQISRLSDWKFLTSLHPFLDSLSEEDRNLYMEKITVSITNGAAKTVPLLEEVFQSKLYYVTRGHVKELFGLKREPVSDITLVRKKPEEWSLPSEAQTGPNPHQDPSPEKENKYTSFIVPVILSSDPIEGPADTATGFGIHYAVPEKSVRPVLKYQEAGSRLLDENVEWSLPKNGKQYRARVSVSAKHIRNKPVGKLTSPDYHSIWWDHKMVGAVIVGSSLYGFSQILLEEYLAYFQEQGFQFSKATTSNLKQFLLEGIKSCELDYFLKESHSDGDERNIFRFNRANYIAQGVRYGEEGRIEVVYIIFPPPVSLSGLKTDLLSNRELGRAMEERESKGCGQLTYFNTSCWSHVKARYEIEAVNSPLFLNIPSISLTDTFLNKEGEAIRSLLHSYRKGLDFKGFRKALKNNEGHKSFKSNLYVFPDQAIYHEHILNLISVPLDIKIKLEHREGESWLPLHPDEAL